MATLLLGLVTGALALFVANWALTNVAGPVESLTAAIELSTTVIGYISLAAGLGAVTVKAAGARAITALTTQDVAGPAVFALAGAILLI